MEHIFKIILVLFISYATNISTKASECGEFYFFNFRDTIIDDWIFENGVGFVPKPGFAFDMYYEKLDADNTGYISFDIIDNNTDTLTQTEYYRFSRWFPFKPKDTVTYNMAWNFSLENIPSEINGYLITKNPECIIPISGTISNIVETKNTKTIYPNPANNLINLDNSLIYDKILIYDQTGKIVIEQQNNYSIDITQLISGSYTILAYVDQNVLRYNFIKE